MQEKYVSIETGEILSKKEINKSEKKHKINSYVGIDTKFPIDCKTEDQFIESLSNLDPYIHNPVFVNVSGILKMVTDGNVTVKEAALITFLCESVVGWNYYTGRQQDMSHIITNSKNLAAMLKVLEEKKLIKILHKGFFHKDSVVIQVNPFYTWKGDIKLKDSSVANWYFSKQ